MLKGGNQIIEFETTGSDASEFPFIFVQSPWALRGEISKQKTLNVIEGTTAGVNVIKEVTINTKDNRAYNLNEILNSRIPDDFELYGGNAGPWTLMMNPGISDGLGVTANKGSLSSYPNNFAMMPVGKFRVLTGDCPPAFDDDGTQPFTDDFTFGGNAYDLPFNQLSPLRLALKQKELIASIGLHEPRALIQTLNITDSNLGYWTIEVIYSPVYDQSITKSIILTVGNDK